MRNTTKYAVISVLLIVLVALAACGGGGATANNSDNAGNGSGSGSTMEPVTLEIGSDGEMLAYNKTELTVKAGQEVTLVFNNNSASQQHNWVLADGGDDVAEQIDQAGQQAGADADYLPEDTSDIIAHTELVNGGETAEITFTAPSEPGEYTYLCTFPGHFQAGMKGTLIVE